MPGTAAMALQAASCFCQAAIRCSSWSISVCSPSMRLSWSCRQHRLRVRLGPALAGSGTGSEPAVPTLNGHLLSRSRCPEAACRTRTQAPVGGPAAKGTHWPAAPAGSGWCPGPLPAPPSGADYAVAPGAAAPCDLLRPGRRRCRRRPAAVCQRRVRRLPRMRHPGPRLPAPALRRLRSRKLVAFSCKRRGFCPSCGARRMAQTAAHLVDHVIPHVPVRQWVLPLPIPLRLLLAAQRKLVTSVPQVVHRVITRHLLGHAGRSARRYAARCDGLGHAGRRVAGRHLARPPGPCARARAGARSGGGRASRRGRSPRLRDHRAQHGAGASNRAAFSRTRRTDDRDGRA